MEDWKIFVPRPPPITVNDSIRADIKSEECKQAYPFLPKNVNKWEEIKKKRMLYYQKRESFAYHKIKQQFPNLRPSLNPVQLSVVDRWMFRLEHLRYPNR